MKDELPTGLPSIRQVQALIKDTKEVEIKLMNGETFVGKVLWQDSNAICFKDGSEQMYTFFRHAIAYLKLRP